MTLRARLLAARGEAEAGVGLLTAGGKLVEDGVVDFGVQEEVVVIV